MEAMVAAAYRRSQELDLEKVLLRDRGESVDLLISNYKRGMSRSRCVEIWGEGFTRAALNVNAMREAKLREQRELEEKQRREAELEEMQGRISAEAIRAMFIGADPSKPIDIV